MTHEYIKSAADTLLYDLACGHINAGECKSALIELGVEADLRQGGSVICAYDHINDISFEIEC